jgi:hypothetical protein
MSPQKDDSHKREISRLSWEEIAGLATMNGREWFASANATSSQVDQQQSIGLLDEQKFRIIVLVQASSTTPNKPLTTIHDNKPKGSRLQLRAPTASLCYCSGVNKILCT